MLGVRSHFIGDQASLVDMHLQNPRNRGWRSNRPRAECQGMWGGAR
jgi:hypothetical protein